MNTPQQTARDARALLESFLILAQFEREFAMNDPSSSQRFQALYKAIGKMNPPEPPAGSPFGFDVEEEDDGTAPANVAEIGAGGAMPIEWATVEAAVSSAERRAQKLARVRAERELALSRLRVTRLVSGMRRAMVEKDVFESESAVRLMEERLRNGGHTGRLGWMQAQASRGLTA
jgi:hypothetical protein